MVFQRTRVHIFHSLCFLVTTFICAAVPALELKLRQSQERRPRGQEAFNPATETRRGYIGQKVAALTGTELQQLNNSNTKPNVEETVNIITNRLKERRREMGLPDNIKVGVVEMPSPHTHTHTYIVIVYTVTVYITGSLGWLGKSVLQTLDKWSRENHECLFICYSKHWNRPLQLFMKLVCWIDYLLTVFPVATYAGDVPFPDDYGEEQHAEVFALLWEFARTTSKTSLDDSLVFMSYLISHPCS